MPIQAGATELSLDVIDGIARIVIDRPERKNALTHAMWRELARLVRGLGARPDVRVIVLAGRGKDFSAGADISEFGTVRRDAGTARAYEADNSSAFAALREAAVPTLAAIRGICFGGGFGLAASCDLRIATRDALFSVPAARLGLAYPVDAMADIVHAVGPQMAKFLTFSAGRLTAAQALACGFLLETPEDEAFDARVEEIAGTIAANAPLSIKASKASIRAVLTGKAEDVARAAALGDATFASRDYVEGRAAFAERRGPVFRGE